MSLHVPFDLHHRLPGHYASTVGAVKLIQDAVRGARQPSWRAKLVEDLSSVLYDTKVNRNIADSWLTWWTTIVHDLPAVLDDDLERPLQLDDLEDNFHPLLRIALVYGGAMEANRREWFIQNGDPRQKRPSRASSRESTVAGAGLGGSDFDEEDEFLGIASSDDEDFKHLAQGSAGGSPAPCDRGSAASRSPIATAPAASRGATPSAHATTGAPSRGDNSDAPRPKRSVSEILGASSPRAPDPFASTASAQPVVSGGLSQRAVHPDPLGPGLSMPRGGLTPSLLPAGGAVRVSEEAGGGPAVSRRDPYPPADYLREQRDNFPQARVVDMGYGDAVSAFFAEKGPSRRVLALPAFMQEFLRGVERKRLLYEDRSFGRPSLLAGWFKVQEQLPIDLIDLKHIALGEYVDLCDIRDYAPSTTADVAVGFEDYALGVRDKQRKKSGVPLDPLSWRRYFEIWLTAYQAVHIDVGMRAERVSDIETYRDFIDDELMRASGATARNRILAYDVFARKEIARPHRDSRVRSYGQVDRNDSTYIELVVIPTARDLLRGSASSATGGGASGGSGSSGAAGSSRGRKRSASPAGQPSKRPSYPHADRCGKWNDGKVCDGCTRQHVCMDCAGPHRASACPRRKSGGSSGGGGGAGSGGGGAGGVGRPGAVAPGRAD